ncbi:hypothetical protein DIZ70_09975 [Acinetobacter junii]|uniref:hypothetical protein n=1 Tax=Acinetobacter junii TaxID=40215 RepID=UPI00095088BE|nr:hypothetical protein [Acinetobacter junii]APU47360.1 hypothetical protein BVL33_01840 [Acinetobacter junii]TIE04103.1 hypothetical protein DIZ70_09975 [Acinetobacter junii]
MELPVPDELILGDLIKSEYGSLAGIGVGNGLQNSFILGKKYQTCLKSSRLVSKSVSLSFLGQYKNH